MRLLLVPATLFILGCAASSEVDSMMPASFTGSDGTLPMDAQAIVFDVEVEDEGAPDAFQSDAEVFECDPLTQCGQHCVETQTDPSNCGGCGRTCFFPNAEANCVDGQCQLGVCEIGFFNADVDDSNGCELADECIEGQSCMTSCASAGATVCDSGLQECVPPAETCNAQDDNCDGLCDEDGINGCSVLAFQEASVDLVMHTTAMRTFS